MVLLTMIARIVDGLPLAATMQDDEQVRLLYFQIKRCSLNVTLNISFVSISSCIASSFAIIIQSR